MVFLRDDTSKLAAKLFLKNKSEETVALYFLYTSLFLFTLHLHIDSVHLLTVVRLLFFFFLSEFFSKCMHFFYLI